MNNKDVEKILKDCESEINDILNLIHEQGAFHKTTTLLKEFDPNWQKAFKESVGNDSDSSKLKDSLESLNEGRNQFAHGGNPSVSIQLVVSYYMDACKIVGHLDATVQ